MNYDETLLWSKLESFSIGPEKVAFSFTQRLATENNWPLIYADKVVQEYRKFLFLCAVSTTTVTPSDQVDQAWHLHLSYTRSYWTDLCKNILGKELHHNPTQGGPEEQRRFEDYYNYTLKLYQEKFDTLPPEDIWPSPDKRFTDDNFIRVNKKTMWIIRKRWFGRLSAFAGIGGALLSIVFLNPIFVFGGFFLSAIFHVYALPATGWRAALGGGIADSSSSANVGGDGGSGCGSNDSGCGSGCGGGGCGSN